MHAEDPHGARGSTEHHALDYKKEVKSFNSADILASFRRAQRGEVDETSLPDQLASGTAAARGAAPASAADAQQETYHSLDFKGEVTAFSSESIRANANRAVTGQGDTIGTTCKPHGGGGGATAASAAESAAAGAAPSEPPPPPPAAAALIDVDAPAAPPPRPADGESGIKIRSWDVEEKSAAKEDAWTVDRLKDALAGTPPTEARPPARRRRRRQAAILGGCRLLMLDEPPKPVAAAAEPKGAKYLIDDDFDAALSAPPPPSAAPPLAMPPPPGPPPGVACRRPRDRRRAWRRRWRCRRPPARRRRR